MESDATKPQSGEGREAWTALIDRFGRGWERGKLDWIPEVFAGNAIFFPDPFGGPLEGLEAIEGYWRDVPREQAEVSFRFGEIFTVGPWFSTEFRCTFRRRRTGEWLDVRGALFCETSDGLIGEMRMYWHRAATRGY